MARRAAQALNKAAFLEEHPRCCYCNGERASEELDHAPARICFRRKEGPEGFEFPTCVPCNRAASISELVAAFYIRMMDPEGSYLYPADVDKVIGGVANNAATALPILNDLALARLRGEADTAEPASLQERTVRIPESAHEYLSLFATKLLYATYYRVSGSYAGPKHRRLVQWAQEGTREASEITKRAEAWFGELRVGSRRNVDLGEQFHYRHGYNDAHGYLGLWMRFGQSVVFFCVLGPAKELAALKFPLARYQPIREIGVSVRRMESRRGG